MTEQEMFCCAVVNGNGPKVKWLHTTCHDYWDRLQAKDAEIARLNALLSASRAVIAINHAPAPRPAEATTTDWCMGGRKCRCDPWHADRRPLTHIKAD